MSSELKCIILYTYIPAIDIILHSLIDTPAHRPTVQLNLLLIVRNR